MNSVHVFVDFDGTITETDSTDLLLEHFADPAWRSVEDDWVAGRIGSRECITRQIELVRIEPRALEAFADALRTDPDFPDFVKFCRRRDIPVTILSDGLDIVIRRVLTALDLDLPFVANRMKHLGADRWSLEFPHANGSCTSFAGTCKCAEMQNGQKKRCFLIGDGRSDFCAAAGADFVLAKGGLLEYCAAREIPHVPFRNFRDVTALVGELIDVTARVEEQFAEEKVIV
jgi:2,3-diketo-5-methylthio-1-phosphopentane phosphatase